jgi:hypothetical protein
MESRLDPDPGRAKNDPQKYKKVNKFHFFEVLDVLF